MVNNTPAGDSAGIKLGLTLLTAASLNAFAAPEPEAIEHWRASDESNTATIDHSAWQNILDRYLDDNHPSKVNLFDYASVSQADQKILGNYLDTLQNIDPRSYSKAVQKAYWINFYNALTVQVILDNYPVESITKTGEGIFSFGPWDDELAVVDGKDLTLNDIEHGILRPIWNDNRIHYAVNCASISCPNLAGDAYTAQNTEFLLETSAKAYVNHERGVRFDDGELTVSSIYHWYAVDFGGEDASLIEHLKHYASPKLKQQLNNYSGGINHDYDWNLNQK
ncbi:DUF547 domain-containing protein [Pseudoteredinibacter isoporae]|uniref:DUF547 domain-containing protein n=1 Tax=Pseudoteredinibacter isoporae TaxID=570281 RepID=UPI003105EB7D